MSKVRNKLAQNIYILFFKVCFELLINFQSINTKNAFELTIDYL